MYPPALAISKQAMDGGIQLGEYFVPGGTTLLVSLPSKVFYFEVCFFKMLLQWDLIFQCT